MQVPIDFKKVFEVVLKRTWLLVCGGFSNQVLHSKSEFIKAHALLRFKVRFDSEKNPET